MDTRASQAVTELAVVKNEIEHIRKSQDSLHSKLDGFLDRYSDDLRETDKKISKLGSKVNQVYAVTGALLTVFGVVIAVLRILG